MKKLLAAGILGVFFFLFNAGSGWAGVLWENNNRYGLRVEILKSNSPTLDAGVLENSTSSEYQAALAAKENGYSTLYFVRFSVYANSDTPPDQYFSGDHTVHLSTTDELLTIPTDTGGWASNQQRIVYSRFYHSLEELNRDFADCTVTFRIHYNNAVHTHTVQINPVTPSVFPDFEVSGIIDGNILEVKNIVNSVGVWYSMYRKNPSSDIFEETEQKDFSLIGAAVAAINLNQSYGPGDLYYLATMNDSFPGLRFYVYHRAVAAQTISTFPLPQMPFQVSAGETITLGLKTGGTVISTKPEPDVSAWTDIQQIAGGAAVIGLKKDGTVVAAGVNYHNQCEVSSWSDIKQVDTETYRTLGLKRDGTLVFTQSADSGFKGHDVSSWTGIVQIASGYNHTAGLKSDGTVVAPQDVSSWNNIVQITAGAGHTAGLKSDGTVVAVGNNTDALQNYSGQCDVSGWQDIIAVSAGYYHTVGLKKDGTVVATGANQDWQGDYIGQSDVSTWTDIIQIHAGPFHTVGIKSDGTVVATGANDHGQCDVSSWNLLDTGKADASISNDLGMDFVYIRPGTFTMGSPVNESYRKPDEHQHRVTLTQGYYIQTTEVTQGQWETVMGTNPSRYQNCGTDCPVENVSWDDVQEFISNLNQDGQGTYALPTEAQWEYAARAGSTTTFAGGGITGQGYGYDPSLDAMGWYGYNASVSYEGCSDLSQWPDGPECAGPHPVARKQPNSWGLYDMHGNVWEYCADWYGPYAHGWILDPRGPASGSYRVERGGSFVNYAQYCRSASRNRNAQRPNNGNYPTGFRLVFTPGDSTPGSPGHSVQALAVISGQQTDADLETIPDINRDSRIGLEEAIYELQSAREQIISLQELEAAAEQSYIYGYPLVLMDVTREVLYNSVNLGKRVGGNQLNHVKAFPDVSFRRVVKPALDFLYSSAWLDLREGPLVLTLPDMGESYYLFPIMDAWTNVFATPGTRTVGSGPGQYLITGPGWSGEAPEGMTVYSSPTMLAWMLGRIQANGVEDFPHVHSLQDGITLTPLKYYNSEAPDYLPEPIDETVDTVTTPVLQVAQMEPEVFFSRLASLLVDNPPASGDSLLVEQLQLMGLEPGEPFDLSHLEASARVAIENGVRAAQAWLISPLAGRSTLPILGPLYQIRAHEGWVVTVKDMGNYGTSFAFRAHIALIGLGANLPEDAIYYSVATDRNWVPLDGSNRYRLHFEAGNLPPINAFWSITLYDEEGFLLAQEVNRSVLRDRDPLVFNDDGSLTLYLQADSPGVERENNWLPVPASGRFNLMARLYWPYEEALTGLWNMPGIERIEQ